LEKGSIIGLEEAILTDQTCYATTVLCKSQPRDENGDLTKAKMYVMNAEEFKKLISKTSNTY
jgi:hypothetical protein